MPAKIPILLSFYALTSEKETLVFGQLTFTRIDDLTFKDYSRRKTFRTLLRLYRTRPFANQEIVLHFENAFVPAVTDAYGSFYLKTNPPLAGQHLQKVALKEGVDVHVIPELYPTSVQVIETDVIAITDIDDTLMHSFIYRKLQKLKTLMFTTMEKRKPVVAMQELINKLHQSGAKSFYVSNSEQNLYPLIFRFLTHNNFPAGPIFLKKLRSLWKVLLNVKFPLRNIHKDQTIADIIELFPDKQFVLMGDNTQHDLAIYLNAAQKFPNNIRYIVIRKVVEKPDDDKVISDARVLLQNYRTEIFYDSEFSRLRPAFETNL